MSGKPTFDQVRAALVKYGCGGDIARVTEGWLAGMAGEPQSSNPYGGRSRRGPACNAWNSGWRMSQKRPDDFARTMILRSLNVKPEVFRQNSDAKS